MASNTITDYSRCCTVSRLWLNNYRPLATPWAEAGRWGMLGFVFAHVCACVQPAATAELCKLLILTLTEQLDATWGPASVHSPEVASTNFDCSPSHFVEARERFWFRLFPVNKMRTSPDNLPSRCKELHVSWSTTSTFWRFGELSIQHTTCFWALYQASANTFTSRSSSLPGPSKSAGVLRSNHIPWVRQGSNPFLVLRCYWPLDAAFSHAWKSLD